MKKSKVLSLSDAFEAFLAILRTYNIQEEEMSHIQVVRDAYVGVASIRATASLVQALSKGGSNQGTLQLGILLEDAPTLLSKANSSDWQRSFILDSPHDTPARKALIAASVAVLQAVTIITQNILQEARTCEQVLMSLFKEHFPEVLGGPENN